MLSVSDLYHANYSNAKSDSINITINQGGTSSGKTYSIMQVLFTLACKTPKQVITVAGQDIPNLKKGALRDAEEIYERSPELIGLVRAQNKTDRIFQFRNGSIIEFNSYDGPQDAKSGKRDYLFVNEANGISYKVYTELALRTRKHIFIDYNPNAEFWVHEHLVGKPGVELLISDHRHNPFLDQKVHDKIESLKEVDTELWRVYARGLTGKIEGLIFRNWSVVQDLPRDDKGVITAKLIGHGLDFGFTNDPTAGISVYMQDGELWIDERIYDYGLTNPVIADRMKAAGITQHELIVADSSEPKSIEEIRRLGLKIEGADKGPDSVNNSIDILKRYKMNITASSTNLRKELNTYKWKVNKDGKALNEPVDFQNHAIDALRYIALNKLRKTASGVYVWR